MSLARAPSQPSDERALLAAAALMMAPAGSILLAATTPLSFAASLLIALPIAVIALALLTRQARNSRMARRVFIGLAAGCVATVAYDLVRLVLQMTAIVSDPFRAITFYGQTLLPGSAMGAVAGWTYHVWNGLAFGMFFVAFVRRPGIWKGVGWALLLDTLQTLTIDEVPGVAVGREFLTASVTGHLAYGATLGWCAALWLGTSAKHVSAGSA